MKTGDGLPASASGLRHCGAPAENRLTARSAPWAPHSTLLYPLTSLIDRLDPAKWFPHSQPLEVELGSGDGTFIAQYAQRRPDRNFLAVERLLGRLRKIDRKGLRAGLANLRLVRIEASYLLEYLLPPESVHALHVYFPDPWPKRKHRKNRLVNPRFTELAAQALTPGGTVYLRTDGQDYFAQMTAVFAANTNFLLAETSVELSGIITDFERDFTAKGVVTLRAAFQRR
jgi:tRNA (guanine-N7-)-methyltransferase